MNARTAILFIALPAAMAAQAMVENAMGVSRAATSAAPAKKAGEAIGAVLGGLGRTLESADPETASSKATPAKATLAKPTPARPASAQSAAETRTDEVTFEDPSGIQKGMEYAEMVRRFGPPSLTLTTGPGEETLSYARKNATVGVTVRNGKVASVQKAGG
jgi:hypothetical protein